MHERPRASLANMDTDFIKHLLAQCFRVENALYGTNNKDLPAIQTQISRIIAELHRRGAIPTYAF